MAEDCIFGGLSILVSFVRNRAGLPIDYHFVAMAKDKKQKKTIDLLEAFFAGDAEPDDLRRADRRIAREYLCQRLRRGYNPGDGSGTYVAFDAIGIGKAAGELATILADSKLPLGSRAAAFSILADADHDRATSELAKLPPDDQMALADAPIRDLLVSVAMGGIDSQNVTLAFSDHDPDTFDRLDAMRKRLRIPAAWVYDDGIESGCSLAGAMLAAVATDADRPAIELLECLQKKGSTIDGLAGALLRARTRRLLSEPRAVVIHFSPSGILGWIVKVAYELGDAGWFVGFAGFAEGKLQEGMAGFVAALPEDDGLPTAVFDAGVAAAMIKPLLDAADGESLDEETLAVMRFLRLAEPGVIPPLPDPADSVPEQELDVILASTSYEKFALPMEVFVDLKVPEPDRPNPTKKWFARAVKSIAKHAWARTTIIEATEYMARWHAARGEEREAAVMSRMAAGMDDDFVASPLPLRIVQKSIDLIYEEGVEPDGEDGEALDETAERLIRAFGPVVDEQIRSGQPPIVRATLARLKREGFSAREAKNAIASVMALEMSDMMIGQRVFDLAAYETRLKRLPEID